jgi:hypothetical protein
LNEHQDSLNAELHSLGDRFNSIKDRITAGSRQKLEQWRDDCYKKIDDIFEQKCDELERLTSQKINEQNEELIQIRLTLSRHIQDQDAIRQTIDSMMSTVFKNALAEFVILYGRPFEIVNGLGFVNLMESVLGVGRALLESSSVSASDLIADLRTVNLKLFPLILLSFLF